MPGGSTSTHPGSPVPNQDDRLPAGSAGPWPFFSQIIRIGAANPVLGPLPAFAQPLEGLADGLQAYLSGDQPLLKAHLSGQLQGPEAGRLVEGAGALVQQLSEGLPARCIKDATQPFWTSGLFIQAGQTLALKGSKHITYRLWGTAHRFSDLLGEVSLAAGQDDLAAAKGKGVGGGAKASLKLTSFLLGQWANKHWCTHGYSMACITQPDKISVLRLH